MGKEIRLNCIHDGKPCSNQCGIGTVNGRVNAALSPEVSLTKLVLSGASPEEIQRAPTVFASNCPRLKPAQFKN